MSLVDVNSYYPPLREADMHEKYTRGGHAVYVLVSHPQKYIVPLNEALKLERGHKLITVHSH